MKHATFRIYFAHWVSHVHLMFVPAMMPFFPEFFGVGYLELGLGMSVLMTVTMILQVPMGFVTDKFGPARVLGIGMLLSSVALFSLAAFANFGWFLVVMGILGLVNTVYHPSDYALLAQSVPPNRLGRAFAVHTFSGYFGAAVTPFILFNTTTWFDPVFSIVVMGVVSLLGVYILDPWHRVLAGKRLTLFDTPDASVTNTKLVDLSNGNRRKTVLTLAFNMTVLVAFFALLHFALVPVQEFGIATLVQGYSFEEGYASYLISLFLLMFAVGVLAGGVLADKTSRHGLIAAYSFVLTTILMAVLTFVPMHPWVLSVVVLAIGWLSGMIAPSRDMMVKKIAPAGAEGRMFAIISVGYSIAGVFAPIYLGWFLDNNMPQWVFASGIIAAAAVVAISFFQEFTTNRPRPGEKVSTEPVAIVD